MIDAASPSVFLADESHQLDYAARLARAYKSSNVPGLVVFLNGELGAGKTTFVRGFLTELGHTGVVKSPTYTLVEPYQLDHQSVFHFDLYRLSEPEELEYAGGRDYFDGRSICLIEWPEKADGFLPVADLQIDLSYAGEGRQLQLHAGTETGKKVMLALFPD